MSTTDLTPLFACHQLVVMIFLVCINPKNENFAYPPRPWGISGSSFFAFWPFHMDFSSFTTTTTASSATVWLVLWLAHNVGLTLLNKLAFSKVDFPYPFVLSALHMLCNWMGSLLVFFILDRHGYRKESPRHGITSSSVSSSSSSTTTNDDEEQQGLLLSLVENNENGGFGRNDTSPICHRHWLVRLLGDDLVRRKQTFDHRSQRIMWGFSIIFSLNVAIGNVSLKFVSVNFNQIMRSLVPALTISMSYLLGRSVSRQRRNAVVPIILGVAMACYGDITYTALGFVITVLCIILAALKVVASGELLTGSMKMHPIDLLAQMAPLALLQCLFMGLLTGELSNLANHNWSTKHHHHHHFWSVVMVVGTSGILSFSLNLCSLQANKLTSPLTMCIAGNVKQILMLVLATIIFATPITYLNGAGILLVLIASVNYSLISTREKVSKQDHRRRSSSSR